MKIERMVVYIIFSPLIILVLFIKLLIKIKRVIIP